DASFAISKDGLMDAPEMGQVLATRAEALATDPASESVLILAHVPADDDEDARWKAQLDERADLVRALGFRHVQVETLREDWPEKRKEAEARVRAYVEAAARDGGRAIVIPFRVQGFGPYEKVLAGLDYVSDGRGLVPHPAVAEWVRREAAALRAELAEEACTQRAASAAHAAGLDEALVPGQRFAQQVRRVPPEAFGAGAFEVVLQHRPVIRMGAVGDDLPRPLLWRPSAQVGQALVGDQHHHVVLGVV